MSFISKPLFQRLKNTLIGISFLLMFFYFLNEGLEIVDLKDLLSPSGERLLFILMGTGGLLLLADNVQKMRNWKRRAQPLRKPNYLELLILSLLALFLVSVPTVVLDHWDERLLMYAVLLLIAATAILHRYFESE